MERRGIRVSRDDIGKDRGGRREVVYDGNTEAPEQRQHEHDFSPSEKVEGRARRGCRVEEAASVVPESVISAIQQAVDRAIREGVVAETASKAAEAEARDANLIWYETEMREQAEEPAAEKYRAEKAEIEGARQKGAQEECQKQSQAMHSWKR